MTWLGTPIAPPPVRRDHNRHAKGATVGHSPVDGSSVRSASAGPERPVPVTAVIPAHNRERLIAEAIRSVVAQTLPVAEILVVDDGSTDRTAQVAEALGARVIRQPNQGVAAARNTGILGASEEWVALLDSDDLWEPEKIEEQWRVVALRPSIGFVFTDRICVDEESGRQERDLLQEEELYQRVPRQELAPGAALCDAESLARSLFRGNFISPSTVLARREVLIEAGLFNTRFGRPGSLVGQVEDRDCFLRVVARTETVAIERSLVRYRFHSDNASRNLLRMQMGAVEVADRVFARPDDYPEGAVEFYRRDQPRRLYDAGVLLLHADRYPEARRVLWRSLKGRIRLHTFVALVVALLGKLAQRPLLRLKRRFDLPGLRRRGSS